MADKENLNFFYHTAGKGQLYMQEAPVEKDKILMNSYYPKRAAMVQGYVQDVCDRLDYEGSFIYDEYPDKQEIERVCQSICRKIEEQKKIQGTECEAASVDFGTMGEIVTSLFCQEIHCRRCRRDRCRRFF